MLYEEFANCEAWFKDRKQNERAWKVSVAEILANGCNLDRRNPNAAEDLGHLPPDKLAADIRAKEERILGIVSKIHSLLDAKR
jgi:type I restriction enzyme M protein